MLRTPRHIPRRFNRQVTPAMRQIVARRHQRHRRYHRQRLERVMQHLIHKILSYRDLLVHFALGSTVAMLLLGVGLALFSPILEVKEIRVARTDLRLNDELIQQSLKPLFGRHLVLLSAQEVAPLLTQELPNHHRSAVPDLASVEIAKLYPSALQLRIALQPVQYRLSGSGTDFLTEEGLYVTYPRSRIASGAALPLLTIVDWGVRPAPWKKLLAPAFLRTLHEAEKILQTEFQQTVKSRTVYLRAREFHLQTPSHTLWFDVASPLPEQLDRYRVFLQTAGLNAAKQYVDLRLANAIVYQ